MLILETLEQGRNRLLFVQFLAAVEQQILTCWDSYLVAIAQLLIFLMWNLLSE